MAKPVEQLESVVIRFAGDSGDGMQLTGGRFTSETALTGNDLATYPDFPAEIRAPAGSLPGVSGFQLHFADHDILTPGDRPDVLVAMNPAALKTNLADLPKGGTLIVDTDAFTDRNLKKAGYESNPIEDGSLADYQVHAVQLTAMTVGALKEIEGVTAREAERAKNMFALGLMSWLYGRPTESTTTYIEKKFAKRPEIAEANLKAFNTGYAFGETSEAFAVQYEVKPAKLPPGRYRQITGNSALSWGLLAASKLSKLPLFLGAYPITPASSILEELARHKSFGVRTFQAEDEIAAVGAALGASFGGALGVTTSAGPGVVLKSETVGLAITLELPLLIIDVQRAGPSTGMPTKPEQGDLLMVLSRAQRRVAGARARVRDPGRLLLRGDRGRPRCRDVSDTGLSPERRVSGERGRAMARARHRRRWRRSMSSSRSADGEEFQAYKRDPETLARPWAIPGTPGLEHRIGGLEKANITGAISYDPDNHDLMTQLRAQKVAGIKVPDLEVDHQEGADVLVLSWGGTYGPVHAGVRRVRSGGGKAAHAHLHWLNPFPANLGDVLRSYDRVLDSRDEPRPVAAVDPREVPGRRGRLQPGHRQAVQGRRDRRRGGGSAVSDVGSTESPRSDAPASPAPERDV